MPKLLLYPHPDSPSPIGCVEVEMGRTARDVLRLTYNISGGLDDLAIPPARPASRADGLWKHSCFELFLGAGQGYYEFNFSPSTQWAAYRFDSHRVGMRDAATDDPAISWRREGEAAKLIATIRLPSDVTGALGLSAIVEDRGGNRSFWALTHPRGDPDFHHPACFAAQLPPAG